MDSIAMTVHRPATSKIAGDDKTGSIFVIKEDKDDKTYSSKICWASFCIASPGVYAYFYWLAHIAKLCIEF